MLDARCQMLVKSQNEARSQPPPVARRSSFCEPLLRILRPGSTDYTCLKDGKLGNYQTAAAMADLVREATVKDQALEDFAKQILINAGLDSHADPKDTAAEIFRYCQQFTYTHDPAGPFDAIQSARKTIARGYGDCDDLSILLSTLLALVGFKPRFVLAKYNRDTNGFDHVYVDIELAGGERYALDPSTRQNGPGWEARAIERVAYPIFGGAPVGLGDVARYVLEGKPQTGDCQPVIGRPAATLPLLITIVGGCAIAMKIASKLF